MFRNGTKLKWQAMALAALFLLFSTGAAAAPDCHVEMVSKLSDNSEVAHNQDTHSHSDSSAVTRSAFSISQKTLISMGGTLSNEICVAVGFIVLLLLRFSLATRSTLSAKKFSPPRFQLPVFLAKNIGYLNLTHLKLEVIRI